MNLKRKAISYMLAICAACQIMPVSYAVNDADESSKVFFLDTQEGYDALFGAEGIAVTENLAVSFDGGTRNAAKLQFGADNSAAGKPKITIPVDKKYGYVNVLLGVNNSFKLLEVQSSVDVGFISEIGYDGETATQLFTLNEDGTSLEYNAQTYIKADDFMVQSTTNKYISMTANLNNSSEGTATVNFYPVFNAGTSNCEDIKSAGSMYIKAISFFDADNAATAQEFQGSVKNVSVGGVDYPNSIDYINHIVDISLPRGVTLENINAESIVVTSVSNAYVKTALESDSTASNDSKGVFKITLSKNTAQVDEQEWTINVNCVQATEADVTDAFNALNTLTSLDLDTYKVDYEWILKNICDAFKNLSAEEKDKFYTDIIDINTTSGTDKFIVTKENLESYIKGITLFNQRNTYGDAAEPTDNVTAFITALETAGINDDAFSAFLNDLNDIEKNGILLSVKNETNSVKYIEEINKKSIMAAINKQESEGGLKRIFEENLSVFGLNQTTYENMCAGTNNLIGAYQGLVSMTFADPDDVREKLSQSISAVGIVTEETTEPVVNVRPPSGGGNGGGFSVPKNTPAPTQKPAETTDKENSDDANGESLTIFNDIDSVPWAKESIEKLSELGVINGKGNGEFAPDEYILREDFVVMIVAAFDLEKTDTVTQFEDVLPDKYYAEAIAAAVENGLISGVSDNLFGVGSYISREDIAVISYRLLKKLVPDYIAGSFQGFNDSNKISEYAKEAVECLASMKIINGADGSFNPQDYATRAETAVILDKLMTAIEELL